MFVRTSKGFSCHILLRCVCGIITFVIMTNAHHHRSKKERKFKIKIKHYVISVIKTIIIRKY